MKYIVEVKEGRRWVPSLWTNPAGAIDFDSGPLPVDKRTATSALKHAQRCYPKTQYRIVEAGK